VGYRDLEKLLGKVKCARLGDGERNLSANFLGTLFLIKASVAHWSDVHHPTERISQFVIFHLKPLVQTTQSFIKDTTHFLNKLEQLEQLPENAFLLTLVVSSLYTYPIPKALTHVDTSLIHAFATLLLLVLKLYVTSYAGYLL